MKHTQPLESLILTLRGRKVMLDADLAELYGVPTKRFNEQVKRNTDRFPEDFMFQLTAQEWANLKSKNGNPDPEVVENESDESMRSQIATRSVKPLTSQDTAMRSQIVTASKRNVRHRPYAFTEQGAIMAATA